MSTHLEEKLLSLHERVRRLEQLAPGEGELVDHGSRIQKHDERLAGLETLLKESATARVELRLSMKKDMLSLVERLNVLEAAIVKLQDVASDAPVVNWRAVATDLWNSLQRLAEALDGQELSVPEKYILSMQLTAVPIALDGVNVQGNIPASWIVGGRLQYPKPEEPE